MKKDYQQELIDKIRDKERWPSFEEPDFLAKLNNLADSAWNKHSIEGYLAALLIYHQLAEEMLRLLLRCSEFFIQLEIFPTEIHYPAREKIMFGRVIDVLRDTIEFENKNDIIGLAKSLNEKRISLVHELTKQSSLKSVKAKAKKIKDDFDKLFENFNSSYDWFLLCFKDFRKDTDWDDYLNEE